MKTGARDGFPWLVALLFLLRAATHALTLPAWEGIDEYAHLSVVEHWANGEGLPRPGDSTPRDILVSMARHPLPAHIAALNPGTRSHEQWWVAGPSAPFSLPALDAYEYQQPPLLYVLLAIPFRLAQGQSIEFRLMLMRIVCCAFAAFGIVFSYRAARNTFRSAPLARAVPVLIALFPGLLPDVARVGNDCLAFTLFSALFWLLSFPSVPRVTGAVLAAGLLVKATFWIAVPATVVVLLARRTGLRRALLMIATPFLLSGWWYVWIWRATGSPTGWNEGALHPHVTFATILAVNWRAVADTGLRSFVWFGDWSFLAVRGWMYRVFLILMIAAFPGIVVRVKRFGVALTLVIPFAIAMAYNACVNYVNHGISAITGWYFATLLAPEMVLLTGGLWLVMRRFTPALCAAIFLALDAYATFFVALPFYAGLIHHREAGNLTALHLSRITPGALARVNDLWALALWPLATLPLLGMALRLSFRIDDEGWSDARRARKRAVAGGADPA